MKTIRKIGILTPILIAAYILIGLITSAIPRSAIEYYATGAADVILDEGLYPSSFAPCNIGFFDNWSDSLIVNILLCQDNSDVLKSAASGNYASDGQEQEDVLDELALAAQGGGTEYTVYSNYWLGELLLFKVLLIFMSWGNIRYLLYTACSLLGIAVFYYLSKKLNLKAGIAFAFTATFFCFNYNSLNVQAASELLIMQIALLYFLVRHRSEEETYVAMYFLGSFTCFNGFLYAPMLELGMVCVVRYLLNEKAGILNRKAIECKSIILWGIGYGLTGLVRQLYVYLVLGEQIGLGKMASWSSAPLWRRLIAFLYPILWTLNRASVLVVVFVLVVFVIMFFRKKMILTKEWLMKTLRLVLFSFVFPFTWCAILVNAVGHGFYLQNYVPVCFAVVYSLLGAVKRLNEELWMNEGRITR